MEKALNMIIDYSHVDIRRADNLVLHDISFQVREGEFVYLTGVVGSGKTSLLKTIYGELDIHQGQACVLGTDLRNVRRRHIPALRRQLGIVFQDFKLLMDRSVQANLDFVLKATGWTSRKERAKRILEVLQHVGLDSKLDKMPFELSGGEQQGVCIARAMLNKPRLILADEATGNLDAEAGMKTARTLHELARQGTAVVMATHNNALIEELPGTVLECRDHSLLRLEDDIPVAHLAKPRPQD